MGLLLAVYFVAEALEWLPSLYLYPHRHRWHVFPEIAETIREFQRKCLVVTLFAAGVLRPRANHPLFNTGYRLWLQTTPWVPEAPLPLGTITPGLTDIACLIITVPMAIHAGLSPAYLACASAGGYSLGAMTVFLPARRPWSAYVVAITSSAIVATLWTMPYVAAAIAVGLAIFASIAVQKSLQGFHGPSGGRKRIGIRRQLHLRNSALYPLDADSPCGKL